MLHFCRDLPMCSLIEACTHMSTCLIVHYLVVFCISRVAMCLRSQDVACLLVGGCALMSSVHTAFSHVTDPLLHHAAFQREDSLAHRQGTVQSILHEKPSTLSKRNDQPEVGKGNPQCARTCKVLRKAIMTCSVYSGHAPARLGQMRPAAGAPHAAPATYHILLGRKLTLRKFKSRQHCLRHSNA